MCALLAQAVLPRDAVAQEARPALVPRPVQMDTSPGEFRVTEATRILVDADQPELLSIGEYLARVDLRLAGEAD